MEEAMNKKLYHYWLHEDEMDLPHHEIECTTVATCFVAEQVAREETVEDGTVVVVKDPVTEIVDKFEIEVETVYNAYKVKE